MEEALKIIATSFEAENSAFTYGLRVVEDDGLTFSNSLKILDNTYFYPSASKTTYQVENIAVKLHFRDIRRIYIESGKEVHFVMAKDFVVEKYDTNFGHNFGFEIKLGTDEIPLIASLIYLCNNLKD